MASERKKKIIDHIRHLPAKIACILALIFQAGVMDYFLINTNNSIDNSTCSVYPEEDTSRYAWPAADIVVLLVFCAAFHSSTEHMLQKYKPDRKNRVANKFKRFGDLPLGYIAWFLLAAFSTTKVVLIFKNIAPCMDEENFFGPNILRVAVGLTSVIFLLHVVGHHNAKSNSPEKMYIEHLIGGITFDILDSVDHLDILFDEICSCKDTCDWTAILPADGAKNAEKYDLPCSMENAILAFSCINLILPTLPLAVLSLSKFGEVVSNWVAALHTFAYIMLVNIPFFVIRMILWHQYNKDISVFLVKNVIMIVIGSMELVEYMTEIRHHNKEKRKEKDRNIEMEREIGDHNGGGEHNLGITEDVAVEDRNGNGKKSGDVEHRETQL